MDTLRRLRELEREAESLRTDQRPERQIAHEPCASPGKRDKERDREDGDEDGDGCQLCEHSGSFRERGFDLIAEFARPYTLRLRVLLFFDKHFDNLRHKLFAKRPFQIRHQRDG
jgi:hypothetical protein